MTPRQLLEKLKQLGIIDPAILERIRDEIDNPDKTVKSQAILRYLVKKKQITEQQAKLLLANAPETKKTADEIEYVAPIEKNYDTDDLTGLISQPEESPAEEKSPKPKTGSPDVPEVAVEVDYGATLLDENGLSPDDSPGAIVSPAFNPPGLKGEAVEELAPIAYGGLDDGGFDSGAYAATSGQHHVVLSFKGKRNQGDQWSTKWLYIGFGILGTLLIGVAILWIVNIGQQPEDMFEAAMDSFNKQSYADAAKKFEDYLEQYPKHKDAPTARARRIHSIIRGTYGLKNWTEVIQQADTLLPELAEDEDGKLDLLREDLAVMIPSSLAEVTRKATKISDLSAMEKELTTINGYREVVENPVYIPASLRKTPSVNDNYLRIDNNIRMLKGQIDKEKRYNVDLARIEQLDREKKTDEAFGVYQKLTRNYGDLASRDELRELMLKISKTEQELVVPVELPVDTFQEDRPTMLQSTVVMAVNTGEAVPGLKDEVVCYLVDGAVYGVDAGEGNIVWRRFVGFETSNQPLEINKETIAVSDQRNQDLVAVKKQTGALIWRTEISEPFLPPTVGDQVIIITTESGKVIRLNANTGEIEQAVQLPQPANINALAATRDPYVYQVGSYHNLYVLSNQDYSCVEVHYLGHYEGSISVPPQAWTGFILVAINGGDHCNLHVLKPREKGRGLELVQVISSIVSGTVSTPLERFGRWMLMTSDQGDMKILELYPAEEQNPVRVLDEDVFDAKGGQRAFIKTEGSDLWVAGQGIMRYRINRNMAKFGREILLEPNDTFLSPVHKLDDYLLHVRRRNRSGMLSASLVDAMTLKPVWRTDFGGELAGPPMAFGDTVVAVSNQGDLFSIDAETETLGYSGNPARASSIIEDLKFQNLIELPEEKFACVGPADRKDLLFANRATGSTKLVSLAKPADKPACRPIAMDSDLIIPTATGQVARVNPGTGQMIGTPFQPPIQANTKTPPWFEPTILGNNQFAIASGATDDGAKSMLYLLSGENRQVVKKVSELVCESSIKSRLINDGTNVFGVMVSDQVDKLVSFGVSPLVIGSEVQLEGVMVDGPWMTEAGILVLLDNDGLYCFGSDLAPTWSIKVPNQKLACDPEMAGSQLMLCFRNGSVHLVDPATGKTGYEFEIGQPIIHKPLRASQKMYFGGMDGTVHVVDLNKLEQPPKND